MNRKLVLMVAVLAALGLAAYAGMRDGSEHRDPAGVRPEGVQDESRAAR